MPSSNLVALQVAIAHITQARAQVRALGGGTAADASQQLGYALEALKEVQPVETSAPHRCRAMDLAGELRRYFDSGTLDEASDLYLLLKEVEAMRPEEPSPVPASTADQASAPRAGSAVAGGGPETASGEPAEC